MRMLVLGGGLQGRAVVFDLLQRPEVEAVVCADAAPAGVAEFAASLPGRERLTVTPLDASDPQQLRALIAGGHQVVIDMLPRQFIPTIARLCIEAGVHLVNTYYGQALADLEGPAREAGVRLLPEMGFDPGIDLVLYGELVRRLDSVERLVSYGGGFPEPAADDNPLHYKISWTWEGVLNSYDRAARQLVDGRVVEVPAAAMFDDPHRIQVEGVGQLEAFINGDMIRYVEQLGLSGEVREGARYTLRWPGHCRLWKPLVELGFLAQEPVPGLGVSPREFLVKHLGPRLQYGRNERDLIVLRVEAGGLQEGRPAAYRVDVIDARDLATGLLAMNRAVGFPASIAAQMIAAGDISARGLLAPALDVPYQPFMAALAERGLTVREERLA